MCRDAYFAAIATVRPTPSCPKRCSIHASHSKATRTAGQGYGGQRVRFLAMHPQEAVAGGSVRHLLEGVQEGQALKTEIKLTVPFVRGRFGGREHDAGHVEVSVGQGAYVVLILKGIKQVGKIPLTQLNLL